SRCIHSRALVAHRAGVVDYDAQRHRDVLITEGCDLLRLAVFQNREITTLQASHQPILVVYHGRMQGNFVDFLAEDEDIALAGFGSLPLWLLGRNGDGIARLIRGLRNGSILLTVGLGRRSSGLALWS